MTIQDLDEILFNMVPRCPRCGLDEICAYYQEVVFGTCAVVGYSKKWGFEYDQYEQGDGTDFEVTALVCSNCEYEGQPEEFIDT